ncbi:hypothetical protein XENTR_v10004913 [Xenopus tropicalis]|nr:hypothetical protein XENTR_v10004913 [Xenopus tropicalis]
MAARAHRKGSRSLAALSILSTERLLLLLSPQNTVSIPVILSYSPGPRSTGWQLGLNFHLILCLVHSFLWLLVAPC